MNDVWLKYIDNEFNREQPIETNIRPLLEFNKVYLATPMFSYNLDIPHQYKIYVNEKPYDYHPKRFEVINWTKKFEDIVNQDYE